MESLLRGRVFKKKNGKVGIHIWLDADWWRKLKQAICRMFCGAKDGCFFPLTAKQGQSSSPSYQVNHFHQRQPE